MILLKRQGVLIVMEVISSEIAQNVHLHLVPKDNLKTVVIKLFFHWPLGDDTGHTAVVPKVLERGPENFKNTLQFNRKLEELYGTKLVTAVHKKGERQLIEFRIEAVNKNFIPDVKQDKMDFEEACKLLSQIIFRPHSDLQDGDSHRFVKQRVERERKTQLSRIKKQKDDKTNYAVERLISHMCQDEVFRYSKFGTEEEVNKITPVSLYQSYLNLLSNAPVDIFVIGNFDKKHVESQVRENLQFHDRENCPDFSVQVQHFVNDSNEVIESEQVNQGKLCLGYRTQISFTDERIYPLIIFNGVFGGFPHSRLFRIVREQHSLCYYIVSRLEKSKGILVINAGIDKDDFNKAKDLIITESEQLIKGDIEEQEVEMSKKSLLSAMEQIEDTPDGICEMLLEGIINNNKVTPKEIREKIEQVSVEQVNNIGKEIQLDTVYFMANNMERKAGVH